VLPQEFGTDSLLATAIANATRILHDAARDFIIDQKQQPPTAQAEPVILDFSLNQLIRHNRRPLPLARALYIKMLEQLCRRPSMSLARFMLITRDKPSTTPGDPRPPSNALRHELAELRRRVGEFDLPIGIERYGRGIRARFDSSRLQVNVTAGQVLARAAATRYAMQDFGGAIEYCEQALSIDFDCGPAVWLVARVSQMRQDHLNMRVVLRAETCLARGMLRYTGVIQRLSRSKGRCDLDIAKAQKMAKQMLVRQRRHWQTLRSWPLADRPCDRAIHDHRSSFRELVDVLIEARNPGGALSFDCFARNSIVVEIVHQLLKERLAQSSARARKEAIENLTIEILTKLAMNGWLPPPAMSTEELRKQLLSFLRARRIDWGKILNQSRSRVVRLRDDLHVVNGQRPQDDCAADE
jgi:hypothetical protein